MQPLDRPMSVEIMSAEVIEDQAGSTLVMCADDEGQVMRTEIRALDNDYETNLRGQSALHYLLGELGLMDIDRPDDLVSKRMHRWAWDKVASIATTKAAPAAVMAAQNFLRVERPEGGRFVYVISAADANPPLCKIGIANSPEKRLAQLSTGSPHTLRLELTRFANDARSVEASAHSYFSDMRRNGEWFAIHPDKAIQYIIDATRSAA